MLKELAIGLSVALLVVGCGTVSNFKDFKEKGDSIYLKGPIESLKSAAVAALSEKRLTSPEFEETESGVVIFAEQSAIAGLIFNSYGGYGKVTIARNGALGPDIFSVSAVTRSKAIMEPVGAQDALKGYNYNDPIIAARILDRIKELANERARN